MTTTNYNVGSVNETPVQRSTFLNDVYSRDVYEFRVNGSNDSINLNLHNISFGNDADLSLYRDSNNNGVFDSNDLLLTDSSRASNLDDSINYAASTGTYFAVVDIYNPGSSGTLDYELDLSYTSGPSNLIPEEFTVGNLSADTTRYGSIGNSNTADVYSFSLDFYEGVNINLFGLSSDVDIRLIQDYNNNQIVDSGEIIATSTNGGSLSESISGIDLSGDYFVQVYQHSGSSSYQLNFDYYTTTFA